MRTKFAYVGYRVCVALGAERTTKPGSAGWWLDRADNPPERRPRKDGISLDRIVTTTIELLEAEGSQALSMRRLAEALHTGPASLYRYVASREELTVLVVDEIIGRVTASPPAGLDWRGTFEWAARRLRDHLLDHPAVVPLINRAP